MRRVSISFSNRFFYELGGLLFSFLFLLGIGYFFYKLIPTFAQFSLTQEKPSKVYLLRSEDTMEYLQDQGFDLSTYLDRLELIKKNVQKNFDVSVISEKEIPLLDKNSILLAFDVFNLSTQSQDAIIEFMERGGKMIFNYHFAYFLDGKFQGDKLLYKLTGLQSIYEAKAKDSIFITPNLMSPISYSFDDIERFDYILYDKIPILSSKRTPDAVMSNWQATSTPLIEGKILPLKYAGVMWHGNYKAGSWIYFAFPSYTVTDSTYKMFDYFVNGSIKFLQQKVMVVKYPYIDHDKVVFISEDTEYQYPNLVHFSALAAQYKIPVTAFCVANLALRYPQITKEASLNPYVEIGSHSYSHTKIVGESDKKQVRETLGSKLVLEKITGKKVIGFRPPREEIDKKLANYLIEAGYRYTMEKAKRYFYPKEEYKGLITIPRHGTDDYSYLMNLDWNSSQIYDQIIRESNFLTSLNLLYTLSVHTHLLTYGSNIKILERYMKYINENPSVVAMQGKEIVQKSQLQRNIDLIVHHTEKKIFVEIHNLNDVSVKDFTFRIYYTNLKDVKNFQSEILGVKVEVVKEGDKFIDIRVDSLRPKARLTVIADYE